ncbi:uncharacterized protein ACN63O_020000 [Diretmus argenteus]
MGCFSFVKLMMVFFNLLIFLGGLTLLAMGIWVSVDGGSFLQMLGPSSSQAMQFVNVGFFCIAIGDLLVLLGGLTLLAMGIWVSVDGGSFLQMLGPSSSQAMQFVNVGFFCITIGAVLVLLGGLTLLAMGIWVSVDGGSFLQMLGPSSSQAMQFVNVGFFCIAIGAVLVLLGLLGCCGAQRESKCLLLTFFSIILVIFIAEVAAGVVALAYSSFRDDAAVHRATGPYRKGLLRWVRKNFTGLDKARTSTPSNTFGMSWSNDCVQGLIRARAH